MHCRSLIHIVGLAAALLMGIGSAAAFDDSKYPNLKGQWERFVVRGVPGQPSFDQTKGWGALQGAPLTPEYQAIFEENVKEQDAGGLGLGADHARCVAAGMPFMMVAFRPLHRDNQSVFKERFYLDKNDPNLPHDEITVIDNALTRPWTVDKRYVPNPDLRADWAESICPEYNANVIIGGENFFLSADGLLMPSRKGQLPPDLRYF